MQMQSQNFFLKHFEFVFLTAPQCGYAMKFFIQVYDNNRNKNYPYLWNFCCLHIESVPIILKS